MEPIRETALVILASSTCLENDGGENALLEWCELTTLSINVYGVDTDMVSKLILSSLPNLLHFPYKNTN